jgi:hypothetical protein
MDIINCTKVKRMFDYIFLIALLPLLAFAEGNYVPVSCNGTISYLEVEVAVKYYGDLIRANVDKFNQDPRENLYLIFNIEHELSVLKMYLSEMMSVQIDCRDGYCQCED